MPFLHLCAVLSVLAARQPINSRDSREHSAADQQGTPKHPAIVQVIRSDSDKAQAAIERQQEHVRDSVHEANETRIADQTQKLATVTLGLAGATVILAIFTYRLWSSGERSAKRQLRAYLSVKTDPFRQADDGQWYWMLRLHNTGNSPAQNVRTALRVESIGLDGRIEQIDQVPLNKEAIGGQGSLAHEVRVGAISDVEIGFLQDGAQMWLRGRVDYIDVNGDGQHVIIDRRAKWYNRKPQGDEPSDTETAT